MTVLIYNPEAGRIARGPDRFRKALAAIQRHYPDLAILPTARAGHAAELARQAVAGGAKLIIVAGGDGTVNEALHGMAKSQTRLAILPAGTTNVLACETGIPRDMEKAAARIPQLVPARIALGLLKAAGRPPRYFLLMAGVGLDAAVINRVNPARKRKWGKLAYYTAGFSMLGATLPLLEAIVEGHAYRTAFALAARVANYGGDLRIASRASLFEPRFELVLFAGKSSLLYPFYLSGALVGEATSLPGVTSILTRRAEFRPLGPAPIGAQVDGEAAGLLPATVEIVEDALTLMVPAKCLTKRE